MGSIERRLPQERRRRDVGPPAGMAERRLLAERRMPQVAERRISEAEWRIYFGRLGCVGSAYAVEFQDHPVDIPGRLWGDL